MSGLLPLTLMCFPEPAVTNDEWQSVSERTSEWLEQSTLPIARETRIFVNENLALIPTKHRVALCRQLHTRWRSALFELVVTRMVQLLGAEYQPELPNREGRRPDITASFVEGAAVIEIVAPEFNKEMDKLDAKRDELIRFVRGIVPNTWHIYFRRLPSIGHADSKKLFKRTVKDALARLELEDDGQGRQHLTCALSEVDTEFVLIPNSTDGPPGMMTPVTTLRDCAVSIIRKTLIDKRRQVRAETSPVILAILAQGIGVNIDDFDQALFGNTVSRHNWAGDLIGSQFSRDGFLSRTGASTAFDGVLVVKGSLPYSYDGSTLYVRPGGRSLPRAFEAFEQRVLQFEQGVEVIASTMPDPLNSLHWASC